MSPEASRLAGLLVLSLSHLASASSEAVASASSEAAAPSAPSVNAEQIVVRIIPLDYPPPPPLQDQYGPLYFFLGLLGAYFLVMLMVAGSFCMRNGSPEQQPLQKPVSDFRARPTSSFEKAAWQNADPALVQQYAMIDGWTRAAFVRKVYAILTTQLLITVGLVVGLIYAAFVHGDPHNPTDFGVYITGPGYYLSVLSMFTSLCFLCALMGCKNQYPTNVIGLFTFTLLISFAISIICIVFYREGFGQELMLAFIITCATFLGLTVFTIFSRIDFSFLGPVLCLGIFLLLIWSLIMSLAFTVGGFYASWQMAFAIVGVALFVGFIIYDTYMIITRLGVDDYIIAAIELYLDVINMFLFVLQLLVLCGRR